MVTTSKKKVKAPDPDIITPEDITSATQLARAKMKNVKKTIQAEGLADIQEFNARFKTQKQQVHPDWKK